MACASVRRRSGRKRSAKALVGKHVAKRNMVKAPHGRRPQTGNTSHIGQYCHRKGHKLSRQAGVCQPRRAALSRSRAEQGEPQPNTPSQAKVQDTQHPGRPPSTRRPSHNDELQPRAHRAQRAAKRRRVLAGEMSNQQVEPMQEAHRGGNKRRPVSNRYLRRKGSEQVRTKESNRR